ncbi:serine/threonine protein kinase [Pendulispora brunnea]|uniref:Serine/threonine protein kinase n=1 Tax=Pendulispora brunnea TaxID=2905690 RepID=A0ABZ2KKZ9_9BACT
MGLSFSRQAVTERALGRIGTTIQDKYRIERLVGIGATAAVYAATHRNGHRVAIKVLLDMFLDDEDAIRRFRREAYMANQVGHPGAVTVLDDDLDETGCAFLIMPLLEGETLRARWERNGRRLSLAETGLLMSDVLDVLASAHANGIVHRDIKPDNLFVESTGRVRVLDFGIARRTELDGTATLTGHMVGTPAFMPPEQATGEHRAVGPHSDCWAVSATMFALLTGEYVHHADSGLAQLAAAATRHARSLGEVDAGLPPGIVQCVDKGLAYAPAERWGSAGEMRDALHEALAAALGEPMEAIEKRVRETIARELVTARYDPSTEKTELPTRARPAREAPLGPTITASLRPAIVPEVVSHRRRRRWLALGAALLVTAAAAPFGWWRVRATHNVPSPLSAPSSVLACPILEASGVPEPTGWLGAAAAATVCERAAVILGGDSARTLIPAELLGLPAQPVAHFPKDPYSDGDARTRSLEAARRVAAAYIDGQVMKEPGSPFTSSGGGGFRTTLILRRPDGTELTRAEGRGRALYEAVRQAMDPLVAQGHLPKAPALDPTMAEWSRATDIDGALALRDATFAMWHNGGTVADECRRLATHDATIGEMAFIELWLCAYTLGVHPPSEHPPTPGATLSPGELAAWARFEHMRGKATTPEVAAKLRQYFAAEQTPIGRSVLAATLSCTTQGSAPAEVADLARLAVQASPRNPLGEWCTPWGQLVTLTRDAVGISIGDARQAWVPWDANAWLETALRRDDSNRAVIFARRSWALAPFNAYIADVLADNLLAQGEREEVRRIALSMAESTYPVQRIGSDLLLVRVDGSEARFGAALERAKQAMSVGPDDVGWVRVQRLEIAWRGLEVAALLGRSAEMADLLVRQFLDVEPSPLDDDYVSISLRVPAICANASTSVSKRCFSRFRELRGRLSVGIVPETDAFAEGAERYARGDLAGAAKSWRPFLREPGPFTQVLSNAMEEAFERTGDNELVARLETMAMSSGANEYNGAAPADVRAARRAAKRGDSARARQLAQKVIEAWSVADEPVPAVAEMRRLVARLH